MSLDHHLESVSQKEQLVDEGAGLPKSPDVFSYLDFREYLKDFFNYKKATSPNYSYRVFMLKAGLTSPGHLKLVIDCQRNLTQNTLIKYFKALQFRTGKEKEYFEKLVHYNQAETLAAPERFNLFEQLIQLRQKQSTLSEIEKSQYEFLSEWYYLALYVMVDFPDFKEDPEWISSRMKFKVSVDKIKRGMELLKKLDLIEFKDGKLRQKTCGLKVSDQVSDIAILKYHHSMIELARQALDASTKKEEREFNGVTLSVDKEMLPEIKKRIREFRDELNKMTSASPNPSAAFQLNLHLIPLTKDPS